VTIFRVYVDFGEGMYCFPWFEMAWVFFEVCHLSSFGAALTSLWVPDRDCLGDGLAEVFLQTQHEALRSLPMPFACIEGYDTLDACESWPWNVFLHAA
jgi:hypothetical protein